MIEGDMAERSSRNRPDDSFKEGALDFAIWANQSDDGKIHYSVAVEENYKVGDEWKKSKSISERNLGSLILGGMKASVRIDNLKRAERSAQGRPEGPGG
jgi:hypothetical protein